MDARSVAAVAASPDLHRSERLGWERLSDRTSRHGTKDDNGFVPPRKEANGHRGGRINPRSRRATWAQLDEQLYEQLPMDFEDELLASRREPETLPQWRDNMLDLVESRIFQICVACLIIVNAIIIGFETDSPNMMIFEKMEDVLLLLFTSELTLRCTAYGIGNFLHWENPDFTWNLFDAVLVTVGVIDFAMDNFVGRGFGDEGAATLFRIFRLMRVLRIFRLIRFLKQLYILTYGFALAAMAVFWVTLLMGCLLYVCAIVLVRTYGHSDSGFFQEKYGSIGRALFTLFQLMMQPNLLEYEDTLADRPLLTVFLVFFVIFGSFGMIALLTGVITEAMFEKNVLKQQEKQHEREAARKTITHLCSKVFIKIPTDQYGEASREDVQKVLPKVKELLDRLNPKSVPGDLTSMLDVMDTDGSGAINKTEFCRGLLHIAAQGDDMQPMLLMELQQDAIKFVKNKVDSLENTVLRIEVMQREVLDRMTQMAAQVEARMEKLEHRFGEVLVKERWASEREPLSEPLAPAAAGLEGIDKGLAASLSQLKKLMARVDSNTGNLQGDMFSMRTRVEEVVSDARSAQISSELKELHLRRRSMESDTVMSSRTGECEATSRQTKVATEMVGQQVAALSRQVKELVEGLRLRQPQPVWTSGSPS